MAKNTGKVVAVIALIAAVGTAGFLLYKKFLKPSFKPNGGDQPSPESSTPTPSPSYTSQGAVAGRYISGSDGVLKDGSYGRKIAELQLFLKYVAKVPVAVDGKLGNQTRTAFNKVADNIYSKLGQRPKLTLNTINFLRTWSVQTFGYTNYDKMIADNTDYKSVASKYTT